MDIVHVRFMCRCMVHYVQWMVSRAWPRRWLLSVVLCQDFDLVAPPPSTYWTLYWRFIPEVQVHSALDVRIVIFDSETWIVPRNTKTIGGRRYENVSGSGHLANCSIFASKNVAMNLFSDPGTADTGRILLYLTKFRARKSGFKVTKNCW